MDHRTVLKKSLISTNLGGMSLWMVLIELAGRLRSQMQPCLYGQKSLSSIKRLAPLNLQNFYWIRQRLPSLLELDLAKGEMNLSDLHSLRMSRGQGRQ